MEKSNSDIVLISDHIFTGTGSIISGFVAIKRNMIEKVGSESELEKYVGENTKVYNLKEKVISPGFVDNHVFFTGYIWERIGLDSSKMMTPEEVIKSLQVYQASLDKGKPILGHGLHIEGWTAFEKSRDLLTRAFPDVPVMIFTEQRDFCWLNKAAEEKYRFSSEECHAEACWRLFQEIFEDPKIVRDYYLAFQDMLASKGITSIKEIGFDDYYGFRDVLLQLEEENKLFHRVNLVTQPVGREADLAYGKDCRKKLIGDFIKFMGYNIMVDGDIEAYEGDILDEYPNKSGLHCQLQIDYEKLKETVLEIDKQGFRCCLHAEGDAAVRKVIDIYEACSIINNSRNSRHAIVDMELIDPKDIERLKKLNITAINYVQIMNCYDSYKEYYGLKYFSKERQRTIWPYRSLLDKNVNLCWGTDYPLDTPDIPLSISFASKRKFPDNMPENGFNQQEAITPAEVLLGWTINGQKANFDDHRLGTLEEGKLADIAVLNHVIWDAGEEVLKNTKVCLTISDGRVVYEDM